jgi:para-nitrobenzyl esterase
MSNLIVETTKGLVQGYDNRRCHFFGGIPFSAPTGGPQRFRPPQPVEPWQEVRSAVYPGPIISQNPTRFETFLGPDPQPQSENGLSVNVWTPAADDAKRPVYVWIHGGAYISGSSSFPLYDGTSFAHNGNIVVVGLNYRLGDRGYLHLNHLDESYAGSGNVALMDQVAALEWVRDNIAAFGGDPGHVTVGGQSAGGGAITGLMMMPAARNLFHRAIIQSISLMSFRDLALAEYTTETFMAEVGATSIAELEAAPIETLLAAQRATVRTRPVTGKALFQPVIDGTVLKKDILPSARDGELLDIPIMIGITAEEWKPFQFFMNPEDVPKSETAMAAVFDDLCGNGSGLVSAYREMLGVLEPTQLFAAAMSDWRWRQTTLKLQSILSDKQDVYAYEFRWRSPTNEGKLGAGHCVEIPFCFDNMETPSTPYLIGYKAPKMLADTMHGSWCNFIRGGNPESDRTGDWPRYDQERRATMMFDTTSKLEDDPSSNRRLYWESRK